MALSSILAALLGLAITAAIIRLILRRSSPTPASDRPRDLHHTHRRPVPRLGGLALVAAFAGLQLFTVIAGPAQQAVSPFRDVLILTSLAMFGLGFWDDLRPLGAKRKLLGQILIALVVCCSGLGIQVVRLPLTQHELALHGWGVLLTVLWLVGMTNLINLIDGADGLAGGISLMLMLLLAYVGHQAGQFELLAFGMAGALLGFLWFNYPPARVYLGDGGAYFLGFQIGFLSLVNSHKGEVFGALAGPMFVLALPILDTALAVLRRGLWGLPVFRPDQRHLHHRLRQIGFSRRRVVLSFYAVTLVFLALGFAAVWSRGQWVPGLLGLGALVLLVCARSLSFTREWFHVGRVMGNLPEMRREIQYALSLTRWLELEGGRQTSPELLWLDLIFAARKLGFTSAKLTLADGKRAWSAREEGGPTRSIRQELDGGRSGVLTLGAPRCAWKEASEGQAGPAGECTRRCPCISDANLFEVLSELLAEGLLKAVARWKNGEQVAVRFDAGSFMSQRSPGRPVAALLGAEAGPRPAGANGLISEMASPR